MSESLHTTLEAELRRMQDVTKTKLASFRPSRRYGRRDQIFHLFKSSSKARIAPEQVEKMHQTIEYYLAKKTPIKVSFLWAVFWMAQCPWKFVECHNVKPRLGDYFAPHWLSLIHAKLQKIFPPGCEFFVIDEFEMVKYMDWTREKRDERATLLLPVYAKFDCIKILEIPAFKDLPSVPEPSDEEVVATVVSTPHLFDAIPVGTMQGIVDSFYSSKQKAFPPMGVRTPLGFSKDTQSPRERSTGVLKSVIPPAAWDEGKRIKYKMNQLARARRTSGWLYKTVMGGEPFIDAAIINRGAWSPDIWAFTSPQNGGSVLDLHNRLYSISIAPEYRLKESGRYTPVMLGEGREEYTLYWLPNRSQEGL